MSGPSSRRIEQGVLAVGAACILQLFGCGKDGAADSRTGTGAGGDPLRVAAASDLRVAFEDMGQAYEKKTGRKVDFTFAATGLLEKQLEQGAPYDVFAAANMAFVDDAIKSGACDGSTKALYGIGRLAIWTKGSGAAPQLADLASDKYKKIAIANPDHAPYGKAAKEALLRAGVWDKLAGRLVYGENVEQTKQFAQSGNADVAIIGLASALGATDGAYVAVDPQLHTPLEQALVVCKGRGGPRDRAKDFATYVQSAEGRATMNKHGFMLPSESLVPKAPQAAP